MSEDGLKLVVCITRARTTSEDGEMRGVSCTLFLVDREGVGSRIGFSFGFGFGLEDFKRKDTSQLLSPFILLSPSCHFTFLNTHSTRLSFSFLRNDSHSCHSYSINFSKIFISSSSLGFRLWSPSPQPPPSRLA